MIYLSFMIVNEKSLGFGLLFGQKKQLWALGNSNFPPQCFDILYTKLLVWKINSRLIDNSSKNPPKEDRAFYLLYYSEKTASARSSVPVYDTKLQ